MNILIDTNVLIDFILSREPFTKNAIKLLDMCRNKTINGFVAAHSILNIFYILRKQLTESERKQFLLYLSQITEIVQIDREKIMACLSNNCFSDFEDCMQFECAKDCNANFIITRNVKDFEHSEIKPMTPQEFLENLTI